ncbi:MAG: ComF family protein [Bacteroidales bacterium]|nr:ComF family protein [Bacteroidales bacterium]
MTKLISYIKDFFFLIYPAFCEACGKTLLNNESVLCTNCLYELPRTNYFGKDDNPILILLAGRLKLEYATSLFSFQKDSSFRKLIHKLKYKNKPEIGILLGKELAADMKKKNDFLPFDFIVPVPLHPNRQKQRGYNQSEQIAIGLAEILNINISVDNLIRNIETTTQTKKTKDDRWQNVSGKFIIKDEETFENKHILLVDDVLTTGATIEACGEMLLKINGLKLSVAVLAKV